MKTIEELRSEFEETILFKEYENCARYESRINEYRSDRYSDCSMGFLNGCWFMFQELKK